MSKQVNGNNDISVQTDVNTDEDLYLEENTGPVETDPQTDTDDLEIPQANALIEINQTLAALQDLFEKQIARNQNQTQMFDKMYTEMKDYKESFLLEVLHKPIIHNLIQLYDSFLSIESQLDDILTDKEESMLLEELSQYRKNLENFRFKLEEVLYRMDVTPYKESLETLDRQLHKTRKVISSDDPKQDGKVAEVHKVGFNWRDKVFRPEEVTIFRYTSAADESPLNEEGGNANG